MWLGSLSGKKDVLTPSGAAISGLLRISGVARRLPLTSKRIGVGPPTEVKDNELKLAKQLIEAQSVEAFDPSQYTDTVAERRTARNLSAQSSHVRACARFRGRAAARAARVPPG